MDIQKLLLARYAIALSLTAALTLPSVAEAISIGEVTLQSRLGEPLHFRANLTMESSERINESCLSLIAPDPLQEDIGSFLTEANLSLTTDDNRRYVDISSPKLFNNAIVRLRLQIKCPGTRGVIKTVIISPPVQAGSPKHDGSAFLPPKLSDKPAGESRIEKTGAEEVPLLLAQQKTLEANLQAVQHQVKQLEGELREIKSQRANPVATTTAPSTQAPSSTQAPPLTRAPSAQPATTANSSENRAEPIIAAKHPVIQQNDSYLQNGLVAALALLLVALILRRGARYYTQIKSRNGIRQRQAANAILKQADNVAADKLWVPPVIKAPQVRNVRSPSVAQPSSAANTQVAAPPPPLAKKIDEKVAGEDSMQEEAALYIANGRLENAVKILREIIKRCPSKVDAWTLLLSLYSSLGKAADYERTAREFLKYHKGSDAWSGIQVLGRTLDRKNPLYADRSNDNSAAPISLDTLDYSHPIGNILNEMGVLSKQEITKYLDEFDPKKNGRFGGYLVARKAITLAQLDQALLQQQGVNPKVKPGALPSLQGIENFLADFDPKRHGSVSEFLASRNAVTPEQISQLLQQQSTHGLTDESNPMANKNNLNIISFPSERAPQIAHG